MVKDKSEAVLQWNYIPDIFSPTFYCDYWIRFFTERKWGTIMKCQHSVRCVVEEQGDRGVSC